MITELFRRPSVIARLTQSPAAPHLNALVLTLREQGYAAETIKHYVLCTERFCQWLDEQRLAFTVLLEMLGDGANGAMLIGPLYNLATDRLGAKQFAAASKHLEVAAKADPSNVELQQMLAQNCLLMKNYSCAIDTFRHILQQSPESAAIDMLLGEALVSFTGRGRTTAHTGEPAGRWALPLASPGPVLQTACRQTTRLAPADRHHRLPVLRP